MRSRIKFYRKLLRGIKKDKWSWNPRYKEWGKNIGNSSSKDNFTRSLKGNPWLKALITTTRLSVKKNHFKTIQNQFLTKPK